MAEWSCSKCTYINDSDRSVCEMCQAPNAAPAVGPMPAESSSPSASTTAAASSSASTSSSSTPKPAPTPRHESSPLPAVVSSSPGLDKPLSSGKAPGKKGKGGYYHFSSTPAELAQNFKPKKIDPVEVAKVEKKKGGIIGLSAWNSSKVYLFSLFSFFYCGPLLLWLQLEGGTWEEQDLSTWAQEQMKGKLAGSVECGADSVELKVTEVTGRCSVIYSRGKAKMGFELSVKGDFEGKIGGADVSGKVELKELDDTCYQDEDDYEIDISGGSKVAQKGLLAHFMKQFAIFVAEVKKDCDS